MSVKDSVDMSDKFLELLLEMIDFYVSYAKIRAFSCNNMSDTELYRLDMIEDIAKLYHSNTEVICWFNTPHFYCVVDGYLCSYGREDIDFGPLGSLDKEHINRTIESAIGSIVINSYDDDSDAEDEMIKDMEHCLEQETIAMKATFEHFKSKIEQFNFTDTIEPEC